MEENLERERNNHEREREDTLLTCACVTDLLTPRPHHRSTRDRPTSSLRSSRLAPKRVSASSPAQRSGPSSALFCLLSMSASLDGSASPSWFVQVLFGRYRSLGAIQWTHLAVMGGIAVLMVR